MYHQIGPFDVHIWRPHLSTSSIIEANDIICGTVFCHLMRDVSEKNRLPPNEKCHAQNINGSFSSSQKFSWHFHISLIKSHNADGLVRFPVRDITSRLIDYNFLSAKRHETPGISSTFLNKPLNNVCIKKIIYATSLMMSGNSGNIRCLVFHAWWEICFHWTWHTFSNVTGSYCIMLYI